MRIATAADHAGFELKNTLVELIRSEGHEVVDLGACTYDASDDYPDFAESIGNAVQSRHTERGVLICGSGVGASVAANKIRGVRAGLCHDTYSAHQGVEHDDMNILVLGSRVVGVELARDLVRSFLSAQFSGEERHKRRLAKVAAIESR
ncbi:MAG: ribose 5-phosphate isomerase B [Bryobacteraceae bacterium]|nr:ribose 5-phosphate isomerase B [Bryobacteraceae bacterium]